MRKFALLLLLLPFTSSAFFDKDLFYGMRVDADVEALQEFLIDEGLLASEPTGNFFSLTLKAVKAFQSREGISSTGYVGPITRGKIKELLASQGISSGVTDESGTVSNPPTTAPSSNADVVAKLNEQLSALLQQVQTLQAQQAELQKQNQTLGNIQTQLQQIQQNTTPPAPPQPEPPKPVYVPVKELKLSATYEDENGTRKGLTNGGSVYKSTRTGVNSLATSSTSFLADGVARVGISFEYLVDGVKQKYFSGQWSYTPWDKNHLGSDTNRQTIFNIQCLPNSTSDCSYSFGLSGGMTHTSLYTFTVTIEGITETFTVNVLPNPYCNGIYGDACAQAESHARN